MAVRFLETFGKDVRYAIVQWRRSPGLAAVIVLSLALGIGANTALFTIVSATLLPKIAVSHPEQFVAFGRVYTQKRLPDDIIRSNSGRGIKDDSGRPMGLSFPYPFCEYLRTHSKTMSGVAGFASLGMFDRASAVVGREPMFIDGDMVTGEYFRTLGVVPALGRTVEPADEDPAAPRVGVISDAFWVRVFGRSRSVLGTTITINQVPVTIVGVAPRGFSGLETGRSADIWIPITLQTTLTPWGVPTKTPASYTRPNYWWLQVFGRLRPGVTEQQARAETEMLLRASFAGTIPDNILPSVPRVGAASVSRAYNPIGRQMSTPLFILGAVVVVVLLVACANVATLLLARATTRRKEMSVRLAMGASRARLFRQLLTEHAVYCAAGTLVGLLFAAASGRLVWTLFSSPGDRTSIDLNTMDPRVLGFTVSLSILTTLLFGLVPAVRATRVTVAADLKDSAGGSARELRIGRLRLGRLFVAAQIAMTLPLVVGAGLFLRTLANLEGEQLGFDARNLLLFQIDAGKAGFSDDRVLAAYQEMRSAIESMPGVKAATLSGHSLMSGVVSNGPIHLEGQSELDPHLAWSNTVGTGFFRTMGMHLLLGRPLDDRDGPGSPRVTVINESMARTFFGNENPIGRRFWGYRDDPADAVMVVGVVADAKYDSVRNAAPPTFFVPFAQAAHGTSCFFEVRTEGPPAAVVDRVREIARRAVPGVPLGSITTQTAQIDESLGEERMFASLFTFFGLVALVLACVGLQGTMAYTLRRRTREIGIRMALGAGRASVVRMALAETLVIAIAGIAVGSGLAAGGSRFVRSLMFGVTPLNPATIAAGVGVMLAVAALAGFVPARRAARIDPMQALREE